MSNDEFSWREFLFSFQGRVTRSDYWLRFYLPTSVVSVALIMGLGAVLDNGGSPEAAGFLALLVFLPYGVALTWSSLAVQAKRWHDRDKSGWWILIGFVPIIGGFWVLIECGFLRGTYGPNRFGDDPLDRKEMAATPVAATATTWQCRRSRPHHGGDAVPITR